MGKLKFIGWYELNNYPRRDVIGDVYVLSSAAVYMINLLLLVVLR